MSVRDTRPRATFATGRVAQLAHSLVVALLGLNGVFLYIFFLVPLVIVIVFSFNSASRIVPPLDGFTWDWYGKVIGNSVLLESVENSVVIALSTGVITTVLTTIAGYALYQYPFRFRRVVEMASYIPLITPGLIYSVGLLIYFHGMGIKSSLLTVIVGHVTMTIPFAFIIITNVGLVNLDKSLEEASMDLGATRLTTFRRIILPIIQPALMAAFLFSAILSFNEVTLAFFLSGTKNTLPVYVYSQFYRRVTPEINAISTSTVAVTLIVILCAVLALRLRPGQGRVGEQQ